MKKNPLKLTPRMLLKRGNYLYHFSFWIYGLYYDLRFAKRSLNGTLFYKSKGAYPVQSISYIYLVELIKKVTFGQDDVFVDVGCAWGRLINFLRKKTPIKNFYGVELNSDVAKTAQKYFKKDSNVEIISGNILDNIPHDGTIFYLFNPFDSNVLDQFLDEIEKNIEHEVKILYLYPTCAEVFEKHPIWKKIECVKLTPKHMGELDLFVYKNNYTEG